MADHSQIIIKKKKVHGGHGHHGGSWKVAYADFVTAMMAFFMVMWIMGLSDDTRTKIQGYFNDPMAFNKTQPASKTVISIGAAPNPRKGQNQAGGENPLEAEKSKVTETERKLTAAIHGIPDLKDLLKQVEVTVTSEGLVIEFREAMNSGFFESGSSIIRPEAKKIIAKIAPILKSSRTRMAIGGYTDAEPYSGKGFTNWDLSLERAAAVRRALNEGGVPNGQFSRIEGFADTELLHPEKPLDPSNRRVTILLPFQHQGGDTATNPAEDASKPVDKVGPSALGIGPTAKDLAKTKKKK